MTVVLYRVDNRLVHGQVLEGWVPKLGANAILVVDRAAAEDCFMSSMLESMSLCGPEVRVVEPSKALGMLEGNFKGKNVVVLFKSIQGARDAYQEGIRFSTLNLGNIHPTDKSWPLTDSVHLTSEDVDNARELLGLGVALDARAVYSQPSPDVKARLAGLPN